MVRTLGVGGFGEVVHARDPNLGRDVAVKLVYGGGHVQDSVARMLREGQALARLRHPSVIHVYEAVRVGTDVALLMEYVDGGDLTRRLNDPRFGVAERLEVLAQVASGLEAAHREGIVHRDLKPANILVSGSGDAIRAKIADFGLARLTREAGAFRTEAGVAAYTPGYGAPEQMVDPDHETPRIDWYSFGVVAFRLLRGTIPLPGQRAGAGEELWERALSLDPAERTAPAQLVEELRAVPAERWTPVVGTGFGDAPAAPDAPSTTAGDTPSPSDRAPTTVVAAPETVRSFSAPPRDEGSGPAGADPRAGSDGAWVDVPVYRPPRMRRRGRVVGVPLGLFLGVLLGVAVGLLVVLLR